LNKRIANLFTEEGYYVYGGSKHPEILVESSEVHSVILEKTVIFLPVKKSPVTGLEWPRGFQEVKVPRFLDNGTGWW
jgi:hypothetical protein